MTSVNSKKLFITADDLVEVVTKLQILKSGVSNEPEIERCIVSIEIAIDNIVDCITDDDE